MKRWNIAGAVANQLPDRLASDPYKQRTLFMTVGAGEDSTWAVRPVEQLSAEIRRRDLPTLLFTSDVYSHFDHMDVAIPSFTLGLRAALSGHGVSQ